VSRKRESQFPYRLENLADLPENFRRAAETKLPSGEAPQEILLIPPGTFYDAPNKSGGAWNAPRQAAIFTTNGILHILEAEGDCPATYLPAADLLYAHHSLILLYGRLELVGVVNGALARVVIEYNTVGQYMIQPALNRFLGLAYGGTFTVAGVETQTETLLEQLQAQSYKFASGLRLYGLLPGERLLGTVFQPCITRPFLKIFRLPVVPNCLLALTDRAVIIIGEEKVGGAAYGWLVTLCPRQRVRGMGIRPGERWHEIRFHLEHQGLETTCSARVAPERAEQWRRLWQEAGLGTV
jgi:hypothetical protein